MVCPRARWATKKKEGMINGHGAQELCCSTCVPTHDALHQAAHPRRSPCAHTPQSGAASRLTRPASHGRASRRMSCTQEMHGTLLLRVGCRDEPHDAKGSRRATSAPASLPSRLARPRPSGRRARARACSRSRCLRCAHRCQPRRRSSAPPEHAARSIKAMRGSTLIYCQQSHRAASGSMPCGGRDGLGILAVALRRSGQRGTLRSGKAPLRGSVSACRV